MNDLDSSLLENALCSIEHVLYKSHFNNLSNCATLSCTLESCQPLKLLKIKESNCLAKADFTSFSYILNALHGLDTTLFYMIDVTPCSITTYIGLSCPGAQDTAHNLLIEGLNKLYNPFKYEWVDYTELFNSNDIALIASTTFLPAITPPGSCTNLTLTPFINLTSNLAYTLILTASPICQSYYHCEQTKIQSLYTNLFPFSEISHTTHHHVTNTQTTTCASTHTNNQTDTCNKSTTSGCSNTISHNVNDGTSSNIKPSDLLSVNKSINTSNNDSRTENCSETLSDSSSQQKTRSNSKTQTDTCTDLNIHTINFRTRDLQVAQLLEQIPLYLNRYENTRYDCMFSFNTYFISPNTSDCLFASSSYMGLLALTSPNLYPRILNIWDPCIPSFMPLLDILQSLTMPSFCLPSLESSFCLGLPITSKELNTLLVPLL